MVDGLGLLKVGLSTPTDSNPISLTAKVLSLLLTHPRDVLVSPVGLYEDTVTHSYTLILLSKSRYPPSPFPKRLYI